MRAIKISGGFSGRASFTSRFASGIHSPVSQLRRGFITGVGIWDFSAKAQTTIGNCGSLWRLCSRRLYHVHSRPGFISASRHSRLPQEAVATSVKPAISSSCRIPCSVQRYRSDGDSWTFKRKGVLTTKTPPGRSIWYTFAAARSGRKTCSKTCSAMTRSNCS